MKRFSSDAKLLMKLGWDTSDPKTAKDYDVIGNVSAPCLVAAQAGVKGSRHYH